MYMLHESEILGPKHCGAPDIERISKWHNVMALNRWDIGRVFSVPWGLNGSFPAVGVVACPAKLTVFNKVFRSLQCSFIYMQQAVYSTLLYSMQIVLLYCVQCAGLYFVLYILVYNVHCNCTCNISCCTAYSFHYWTVSRIYLFSLMLYWIMCL